MLLVDPTGQGGLAVLTARLALAVQGVLEAPRVPAATGMNDVVLAVPAIPGAQWASKVRKVPAGFTCYPLSRRHSSI